VLVLLNWWSDIIEDTSVRLDVIVYVISSFLFVCSYIFLFFLFFFGVGVFVECVSKRECSERAGKLHSSGFLDS